MSESVEIFDFPARYLSNTSLDVSLDQPLQKEQIINTHLNSNDHDNRIGRFEQYGPFRLFDLPLEIRHIIYRYAITLNGSTAIAMQPTREGYSVQTFVVDELEGLLQIEGGTFAAASGLHDASKKYLSPITAVQTRADVLDRLRAEVTSIYRTSFNLVLPRVFIADWILRLLRSWGAFPYLRDITLKVFFAPNAHSGARNKRDTFMQCFSDGSDALRLELLKDCVGLVRVHFDIALLDCNQQCDIGPILESKARHVLGSELAISARTTTCDHCPAASDLRSASRFANCEHKREDGNRPNESYAVLKSSVIERWGWTCAPRCNVWDIARFKFDIDSQRFVRVSGLSDIISQYRIDAAVDKSSAKQKLQLTAQELRNTPCDTLNCTALCRGIPTDPRYARAHCCRYCELAWYCSDHYFVGQHTGRGRHYINGYCIKRPRPAADGMVHMAPMGEGAEGDRIYDEPGF